MGQPTDAEVMSRSLEEREAFGAIFDRHAPIVLRFLARRVGPATAEGLLGQTFQIAFERRASFDTARPSARPWLYGIASNLLLKHRRTEARRLRATAALAVGGAARGPDEDAAIDGVDARTLLPRVAEAVDALPDGERAALLLFAWEELSYDDIAAALDVPVGTVRSRLSRARRRVREQVARGAREERKLTRGDAGRPGR